MAKQKKLEIINLPHESLRKTSSRIDVVDGSVQQLIEKLIDQALLWEKDRPNESTVGLAAVQINQLKRVFIIRENSQDSNFVALINPKITKLKGQITSEYEGCLSVDKCYAKVPRHSEVKVEALDQNGQPIKFLAEGFLARIIQHEVDHLKGITIVDRVTNPETDFARLTEDGQIQPVSYQEVMATGIL